MLLEYRRRANLNFHLKREPYLKLTLNINLKL